jgi:CDP-glucose 4,6-dehydratase
MIALITGATGFVGGAIAKRLLRDGDKVVALCRDGNPPDGCEVVRGELEDLKTCERAIVNYRPDVIYHLGAQAIVQHANQDPWSTFESNVRGTYNLLEAFRRHGRYARMIVASSDKAYGEMESGRPYQEDDRLEGRGPYDCSKSCTDLIAQSYKMHYNLPICVVRAGNIYGPDDSDSTRIIPATIDAILNGEAPVIRSDGTPTRDYLYIDDAVDAYLSVDKYLVANGGIITFNSFNFAGGEVISVLDLVNRLRVISGPHAQPPIILGHATNEINHQELDTIRAKAYLGFRPQTSLNDGLITTFTSRFHSRVIKS